jgi:hypothetical protein
MNHAALVSDGLFWFLIFLVLLLVMFIYAVIAPPPEDAVRNEPPTLSARAAARTGRGAAGRAATAPHVSRGRRRPARRRWLCGQAHPAPPPVISPPKAPTGPRWDRVLASIVGIAGLVAAVIGGWLFLSAGKAAVACPRQAAAVCSQGFVVLTATQLVGGAIAVAGIALLVTALLLALR